MKSDEIELLFTKYYNDALLYTVSLSKDPSISEDIVANAFYKALTTADDDERIVNFKAWLFTVCRNLYFSSRRRHSNKKVDPLDDGYADESESIVDEIIRDEEYRALYRAIELLPENQKEVILLYYFENLQIKDICKIVGKSETNVKVTLSRAREGLKKILGAP